MTYNFISEARHTVHMVVCGPELRVCVCARVACELTYVLKAFFSLQRTYFYHWFCSRSSGLWPGPRVPAWSTVLPLCDTRAASGS